MEKIHEKIRSFQRRYYLNVFIRGGILTLAAGCAYFLLAAVLEHGLWLNPTLRLSVFLAFFGVVGYCVYRFLREPIQWWIAKKGLGEEQSAKIIGSQIPGVKDRLVNLLQLSQQQRKSVLAYASIQQKTAEFEPISFEQVIDLKQNRRFLKYLLIPAGILLVIFIVNQRIITDSTQRLIHFDREFSPQAPFQFDLKNKDLNAFYNEDFVLRVALSGAAVPDQVYLKVGTQRFKLQSEGDHLFSYTFENIQSPADLQFEAAGFYSDVYHLAVLNRPELTGFEIDLKFPAYINRKSERLANAGNLEIPEGTRVQWNLATAHALQAQIQFESKGESYPFEKSDRALFSFEKEFRQPDLYEITLENDNSRNRDRIQYQINVVKDQHPQISVNSFSDTVLYKRIMLGGMIADDYGLTQLQLNYRILNERQEETHSDAINIPVSRDQLQQRFVYNWSVDSLVLNPGDQLEYHLKVWDNDGVNGRKVTQSGRYRFLIPSKDELVADINRSGEQTQSKISESNSKADALQDQIEQMSQRLKGKQNLDWQDKKLLDDILNQKRGLDQMLEEMAEQNKAFQEKKNAFSEEDERIRKKAEEIQKLMEELLDEETKKLFEELQRLLKEKTDVSQLQKLLEKLNQNTKNLEKELDRMLDLYKQLQFESQFDQALKALEDQIREQEALLEKTEELAREEEAERQQSGKQQKDKKSGNKEKADEQGGDKKEGSEKEGSEDDRGDDGSDEGDEKSPGEEKPRHEQLAEEQKDLKERFEKMQKKMDELRELGEELNQDDDVPSEDKGQEIMEHQDDSQENLQQNQPGKSKQPQQRAVEQMKEMQEQMEGAQNASMMEMDMENLESLRHIIHGLIKLSFDQESLLKSFSDLQNNDPRFNQLAEDQLKLQDNAKVLEDSLLALAKRDPFMGSFVTKEISELNEHLDKVSDSNKERRKPQAQSEMQMAMTSLNNLALMLDSHFDMMMQMMANAKPSAKKGKSKGKQPSLGQLQQQLNQKIQELKESGKSGRQLSEELAELAAEQERIRRAMEEMQEKMQKDGKMPGGDLPGKMEQTETELVNKQLTEQLIRRQQEILTRLLEAEKSMREQDLDEERKGETAKDYEKEMPRAFEEYLRLKEKEVELLKTVPPKLYPYYKKQVDEYFKRMSNSSLINP